MKISLEKLKMHSWFEDDEGNIYPNTPSLDLPKDKERFRYHSVFPCTYTEELYEYCVHESKDPASKTFSHLLSMNVSYGSKTSQECIVAMVNSGDYTLEEAIFVYTNACERCSNVLLHKYLNGADGYEEYSEEWYKANTVCDWCREEEQRQPKDDASHPFTDDVLMGDDETDDEAIDLIQVWRAQDDE